MGLLRRQKRTPVKVSHVQCRMMGKAALPENMLSDSIKPELGKTVQTHLNCHETRESKGCALSGPLDYVRHNLLSPTDKTIYT